MIAYLSELFAPYGGVNAKLYAEIRVIGVNRSAAPPPRFFAIGEIEKIADYIRNQRKAFNVFVGVLPRSRIAGYGHGGCDGDIFWAAWLWADIDAKTAAKSDVVAFLMALAARVPRPYMIVFSGSGGVHLYWRLRGPIELDAERRKAFSSALRRLVLLIGEGENGLKADPACTNVSRILRVPNTLNHKHDPPAPVKCIFCTAARSLTWDEWRALLPFEPQPVATLRRAGRYSSREYHPGAAAALAGWAEQGYVEGGRHRGLVGAAAFLRRDTDLNDADARALFDQKASRCTGEHPVMDKELQKIWDWAAR
jgi:hypothetical protein